MDELGALKRKRAVLKATITRYNTFLDQITENTSTDAIKARFSKIESIHSEYEDVQFKIEMAEEIDIDEVERGEFENSYYKVVDRTNQLIKGENGVINNHDHANFGESTVGLVEGVKLPTIDLPKFKGKIEDWLAFNDAFVSMIDKNKKISPVQKLHYLRSCLEGEPADMIASLETTASSYIIAVQLLNERYDNKRIIIQNHVKLLNELPSMMRGSAIELRKLIDGALKHIRALNALEQKTENWDALLLYIVTSKLDRFTRSEWERSLEGSMLPKMDDLWKMLRNRCHVLETINPENNVKIAQRPKQVHLSVTRGQCVACKEVHNLQNCQKFANLEYDRKIELIKQGGVCFQCLRVGHIVSSCRGVPCSKCNRKHHTILHPPRNDATEANARIVNSCTLDDSQVVLSTAMVDIVDSFGNLHACRVMLDAGSQSNFISESLSRKLGLPEQKVNIPVKGIGDSLSRISSSITATIKSRACEFMIDLNWLVIPCIVERLPLIPINKSALNIPRNIRLADPRFYQPREVDALIGAEFFYHLLSVGQVRLENSLTILQKTRLGWIIAGRTGEKAVSPVQCFVARNTLDKQMEDFWKQEEISEAKLMSPEEEDCENFYRDSVCRDLSGRYMVSLPFTSRKAELGESRGMAARRFYTLEKKFKAQPDFREAYANFMTEYINLGHMKEVPDADSQGYFIPHHAVWKEDSLTTKLRVVFNGSAKTSTGVSLNDTLMVGPVVQDELFIILLRFRNYNIALSGDIEKMYRQILIHPEDRKYQRILWREDLEQPLKTYELQTVTYGTAPAPFLATRTLKELATDERKFFPHAASALMTDTYVDDVLTGADDEETAEKLVTEMIEMTTKGGFRLRKWASNAPDLVGKLAEQSQDPHLCLDPSQSHKTLGIYWQPSDDIITYKVELGDTSTRVTKRSMLSQIMSLFDPLGLLAPVIVKAKLFMQDLWKLKLHWDESVPMDVETAWKGFRSRLPSLTNLKIPRRTLIPHRKSIQLHGFCDASESAYGAAIYLRSVDNVGNIQVSLISSKTRVAPLSKESLPRLELCAAVTLSELYSKIKNSLRLDFDKTIFWTDSMITLHWIRMESRSLQTYVGNRVAKIQRITRDLEWRHVSSHDNPADLASRGILPDELHFDSYWFHGPLWLSETEDSWPTTALADVPVPEQKSPVVLMAIQPVDDELPKISCWRRLLRVMAYVLRFSHNCRAQRATRTSPRRSGGLSAEELDEATSKIVMIVQRNSFAEEIRNLKNGRTIPICSKLLSLSPFLDSNGILRVGGRLRNSGLSFDQTHPMLLPDKHYITLLILRDAHRSNCHAGKQAVLHQVRQRFWPINGKSRIQQIIRECVVCFRVKPRFPGYLMGDLPSCRFNTVRPFANVGMDFCGPFFVKEKRLRNRGKVKVYVCVYICMTTKAIHLEVVSDLTTEAFIASLKRFVSRRGLPIGLFSDNATNFIGANNELHELYRMFESDEEQVKIMNYVSENRIKWHFIPPRSPHFGGIWESAVKSFKHHLVHTIGDSLLTYEALNTVVTEIEAILNSRPLTPLSSDPNDLAALTPGHFLIGGSLLSVPENDLTSVCANRLSSWQTVQQIKRNFWTRWQKEYLNEINQRVKWNREVENELKIGSLVLVKDDNLAPLHWALARVVEVHPGRDNVIRVATVKTAKGLYKRAIKNLAILPVEI